MRYLHTMLRVADPESSIRFFTLLGLKETRRMENQAGRYTLISFVNAVARRLRRSASVLVVSSTA